MRRLNIFQVIGNVGKLTTDIFKAALFQMFLNSGVALRITINSDCTLFLILFIVFVNIKVNHVKNEFFHVHAVFLLESEHTFMVEQESQ